MRDSDSTIHVVVDSTNPGQFFACCGLLELADRLWPGALGSFTEKEFLIWVAQTSATASLESLVHAIGEAALEQVDSEDDYTSPIKLGVPFDLRLDWWFDNHSGGKALKVWAGSMRSVRIARAMQSVFRSPALRTPNMFDHAAIVYDPLERDKKVEPYYFDCRRGANAQSLDIGFAPDALQMTTVAFPAVEFLCLVGLQRCRPHPTDTPRVFDYYTWSVPLPVPLVQAAVCGLLCDFDRRGYRFENGFRTDQRKHKAFLPATPLGEIND